LKAFLDIRALSLQFSALKALSGVTFHVPAGSIYGLIGPNGAGKTTLLNCLSRVYTPTSGAIAFEGQDLLRLPIHRLAALGITRTFQNIEVSSQDSVRQNAIVGALVHHRSSLLAQMLRLPAARRQERRLRDTIDELLREFNLLAYAEHAVSSLPFGSQKTLELVRAVAGQPRLLLLDEPAAGMNPEESRQLALTIRKLRDERGITILLIEHDMSLVMNICDRIAVLDHGELICDGSPFQVRNNAKVIEAYLGEDVANA
jgi:branched-chain amino acid transport system ATP-binding protein